MENDGALVAAIKVVLKEVPDIGVKRLTAALKTKFQSTQSVEINAKAVKAARGEAIAQLEAEAVVAEEAVVADTSMLLNCTLLP